MPAQRRPAGGLSDPGIYPFPSPLRVLIADGNADAADSLALLLGLWGHDCRTAYNGPAALEAARAYRPHVVLAELVLSGLDGCELARCLRAECPDSLPFALTGLGGETYRARAGEAGFLQLFVKPAEPDLLCELLVRMAARLRAGGCPELAPGG